CAGSYEYKRSRLTKKEHGRVADGGGGFASAATALRCDDADDPPIRNAGGRGQANRCLRGGNLVLGPAGRGRRAPFGAKFARRLLPVAHWNVLRISHCANRVGGSARTVRGVREGTCPRAYRRPPGGRVRAFQSIRTICLVDRSLRSSPSCCWASHS